MMSNKKIYALRLFIFILIMIVLCVVLELTKTHPLQVAFDSADTISVQTESSLKLTVLSLDEPVELKNKTSYDLIVRFDNRYQTTEQIMLFVDEKSETYGKLMHEQLLNKGIENKVVYPKIVPLRDNRYLFEISDKKEEQTLPIFKSYTSPLVIVVAQDVSETLYQDIYDICVLLLEEK